MALCFLFLVYVCFKPIHSCKFSVKVCYDGTCIGCIHLLSAYMLYAIITVNEARSYGRYISATE